MKRTVALLMIGMLLFGVSACSKDSGFEASSASNETAPVKSDVVSSNLEAGASSQDVTSVEDDAGSSEETLSKLPFPTGGIELPRRKHKNSKEFKNPYYLSLEDPKILKQPEIFDIVLNKTGTAKLGLTPEAVAENPDIIYEIVPQFSEILGFEITALSKAHFTIDEFKNDCVSFVVALKYPEYKSREEVCEELKKNKNTRIVYD